MGFKRIYDEKKYKGNKYLIRSYSKDKELYKNGSFLASYESIKNDCLITKQYCIVECKTEYYFLCWDIDFKKSFPQEMLNKHYEITEYIITKINNVLNELIITANCSYVYAESTIGYGKHIYYPDIIVDRKFHEKLYSLVMCKINKDKKYNFEDYDIIDDTVCKYNGIRLFGSINDDGAYYYPVKDKSTVKITGDIEKDFDYCLLNTECNKYNFELKIIFDSDDENVDNKEIQNYKKTKTLQYKSTKFSGEYKKMEELILIIKEYNKKYVDWIKIGMSLYNTDNSEKMMDVWHQWSSINYNCNYDEISKKWDSFNSLEKGYTMGTLRKMAKDTNYDLYIEWYNKYYKYEIVNLIKDFDQQTCANYFKNKKPNSYIYKRGEWFALLENNLWKKIYKNENSKMINDITDTIKNDLIELKNNLKPEDELLKTIPSVSKKLGTSHFIYGIIDFLRDKYNNDEIEFDFKSNLFGFNNLVYDLQKNMFRNYEKNDYVTITVGYNWSEPVEEEIKNINDLISKIHIDETIRSFYLDILCSALWGITLQYYIFFNGSGSNGKSVLSDLLIKALGDYAKVINSIILCEKRKQGANTELANLSKKRLVIAREPPKTQNVKLSNSLLKELTGGCEISARKIYSDDEKTPICMTLIIECNQKPLLEEEPTDGDIRRIIDLLFETKFVDDGSQNNENRFKKDVYYVSDEFRNKHKCAILKILFEHNKNYKKELIIPEKVIKRTNEYIEASVEIFEWFKSQFEKVENYKNEDFISFQDINNLLKLGEYYQTLSKIDKRKLTREKLVNLFKENSLYNKYYRDDVNTHIDGIKVNLPKRLIGFKIKDEI